MDTDQWPLILGGMVAVIAALGAAAVNIIGALHGVSQKVGGVEQKVDMLEIKVDGRLTQLLERTAVASRAEGVDAGRGEIVVPLPPIPVPIPTIVLVPPPEPKEENKK